VCIYAVVIAQEPNIRGPKTQVSRQIKMTKIRHFQLSFLSSLLPPYYTLPLFKCFQSKSDFLKVIRFRYEYTCSSTFIGGKDYVPGPGEYQVNVDDIGRHKKYGFLNQANRFQEDVVFGMNILKMYVILLIYPL
jgi:hypothetical protein